MLLLLGGRLFTSILAAPSTRRSLSNTVPVAVKSRSSAFFWNRTYDSRPLFPSPARKRTLFWALTTWSALLVTTATAAPPSARASTAAAFSAARRNTMSSTKSRTADGTITVAPKREGDQSALVVICHGLGDTAEGVADVAEFLAAQLPHCKFVLPTAPVNPVTLNGGMPMNSWYDIVGLDERSNEACRGINESREKLLGILRQERQATQLPYSRMVLAGFSQGGALSLFTGLQLDEPLAGVVILSGYLPCAKQFQITPGLESTPIFHGHGTQDIMVAYGLAQKTRALVVERGAQKYELKAYNIGHTISTEEVGHMSDFLKRILPDDPSFRVRLPDPRDMSVRELKAAVQRAGLAHKAAGFCEKSEYVKLLEDHRSQ